LKYLFITAFAILGALFVAPGVASAHHVTLGSEVSCIAANGSWTVTWSATNSESNKRMVFDSITLETDTNTSGSYNGTAADPAFADPVGFSGTTTADSTFAGTIQRVRLSVQVDWESFVDGPDPGSAPDHWEDSYSGNYSANLTVPKPTTPCVVDVCPNIDGVQAQAPSQYPLQQDGKCYKVVEGCFNVNGGFVTTSYQDDGPNPPGTLPGAPGTLVESSQCEQVSVCHDGETWTGPRGEAPTDTGDCDLIEVCVNGVVSQYVEYNAPQDTGDCGLIEVCVNGVVSQYVEYDAPQDTGDCGLIEVCVNGVVGSYVEYDAPQDTGDCDLIEVCVDGEFVMVTEFEANQGEGIDTDDCGVVVVCVKGEMVEATEYELTNQLVVETDDCDTETITIIKDTNPETDNIEFDFDGSLGDFDLEDDESITFERDPGTYTVEENLFGDWELADISCSGGSDIDIEESNQRVIIHLKAGEHVTCTFVNDPEDNNCCAPTPEPSPSPSPSPSPVVQVSEVSPAVSEVLPARLPATGNGPQDGSIPWTAALAAALVGVGSAVVLVNRRRNAR